MHLKNLILGLAVIAVVFGLTATLPSSEVAAYPSFYNSNCASCHGAAPQTCDGCHFHKGTLSASTDKAEYIPGEAMIVTLSGGTEGGWIGAVLRDHNNQFVNYIGGEGFPVDIPASAPANPGDYNWTAYWFGSNGTDHLERSTPVTVTVVTDPSGVGEAGGIVQETWGRIKSFFKK